MHLGLLTRPSAPYSLLEPPTARLKLKTGGVLIGVCLTPSRGGDQYPINPAFLHLHLAVKLNQLSTTPSGLRQSDRPLLSRYRGGKGRLIIQPRQNKDY